VARNIRVSNTPTAVDDATADTGIWLMLGALRNLNQGVLHLRRGEWQGAPKLSMGRDPQNKVLGILGMGGIGRNMAKKALAFGMKIRYYNRTRLSEDLERECQAEYCGFEELLKTSDVLSLNLPLNVSYKTPKHTLPTSILRTVLR
jgi:glyoxylate reductase